MAIRDRSKREEQHFQATLWQALCSGSALAGLSVLCGTEPNVSLGKLQSCHVPQVCMNAHNALPRTHLSDCPSACRMLGQCGMGQRQELIVHCLARAQQGSLVMQQQLATGWEGYQQRTQRQGTVSQVADAICRQDNDKGELL